MAVPFERKKNSFSLVYIFTEQNFHDFFYEKNFLVPDLFSFWKYELPAFSFILNLCQLQINDSNVEEKDVELVMQQANVSKSKVWY